VKESAIARRVRGGRLEFLHCGVYALPQTSDIPLAAETAGLLACGEGAVLSHHSAVTLWQLRPGTARPIHITIPRDTAGARPPGTNVHRSRILAPGDLRVHDDLPVVSPARALLDVAPRLADRDVEQMLDEALFARRIVTLAQVGHVLRRAGSHPGRARLARAAANYSQSTRTESPPEETLLRLIRAAGLPEPRTQFPVLDFRLDFYWPELRLAVEVDAYGTHGSRTRFEQDRRRDARLLSEQGIVVLRVTRLAVETRPLEVVALVAGAIAQREVSR
jgi:very-short-patch-repair endonuclease